MPASPHRQRLGMLSNCGAYIRRRFSIGILAARVALGSVGASIGEAFVGRQ